MSYLLEFIATGFYVGKFPFAPGTLGTLVGIPLVLLLYLDKNVYLFGVIALFFLGWISSEYMVNVKKEEDPEEVVIDEIVGYILSFLFVEPTIKTLAAAFIIFRLIDIYKPFPVNLFENFPGGLGVMMDDIAGGLITAFVLYLLIQ